MNEWMKKVPVHMVTLVDSTNTKGRNYTNSSQLISEYKGRGNIS